jgi:hypothetical protein
MVTAFGQSCAGAGGGEVFSREHCGQTLVRHRSAFPLSRP